MKVKVQLNQMVIISDIAKEDMVKAQQYGADLTVRDAEGNEVYKASFNPEYASFTQFGVNFSHIVDGKVALAMPLPIHLLEAPAAEVKEALANNYSKQIAALKKNEKEVAKLIKAQLDMMTKTMEEIEIG